jgi:hypothetical protein
MVLPTPPLLQRPRNVTISIPRQSSRVAKKARRRTLAVAAAQNALMRNLGLTADSQSDTDTFDKYVKLFNEGLTKSQVQFIKELFMQQSRCRIWR